MVMIKLAFVASLKILTTRSLTGFKYLLANLYLKEGEEFTPIAEAAKQGVLSIMGKTVSRFFGVAETVIAN